MTTKQPLSLITYIFLFIAACICITPVLAVNDAATTYYNSAKISLQEGEYQRAVDEMDLALTGDTTLIGQEGTLIYVYNDKVGALIKLEQYDNALTTAERGLEINPDFSPLWNAKGEILYKMGGRNTESVDAYDKAILTAKIDSSNVSLSTYLTNKGDAQYADGQYQGANITYADALAYDPGYTRATEGIIRATERIANPEPETPLSIQVILSAVAIVITIVGINKKD